jgi:hypothetical protein
MSKKICEYCCKEFKRADSCSRHKDKCIQRIIKEEVDKSIIKYKQELLNKENEIKLLRELLDKQMNKPTTTIIKSQTNNSNDNITVNNKLTLKQIVSKLDPVDFEEIKNSMDQLTDDYIDRGLEGFAYFLCNHPCKNKIVTTDNARNVIAYRTKKQEFVRDPEAHHLINRSLRENADTIIERSKERHSYWKKQYDDDMEPEFQTRESEKIGNTETLLKGAKKAKQKIHVKTKVAVDVLKQIGNENVNHICEISNES